jgi:CRISPR/Cas system-associated endonuclease Cas1
MIGRRLARDLLEEFRHGLVDRLVLRLINSRSITADDFEDHGDRGLRFGKTGVRKYVAAYEKVLTGTEGEAGTRRVFLRR